MFSERSSSNSYNKHEGDNQNSQGDYNREGNRDSQVNNPNQENETHYAEGNKNDSNVAEKSCSTESNSLILEDKNQPAPAEGINRNPEGNEHQQQGSNYLQEYNEYHHHPPGFPCQSCHSKEQESTPPESLQTSTEKDLLHEMLITMGRSSSSVTMANEDDGDNDDDDDDYDEDEDEDDEEEED